MKKITVLLMVLLIAVFALFALGSGEDTTVDQGKETAAAENKTDALGDYSVVIDSCRLAKDYEGKDVVIVKYKFTNVSDDEAAAFTYAINDEVFQDGVGLNNSYFLADSANYSSDNQTKEIKIGASIEVEVAYELNNTTSDVEVEVSELISFDDKKITKTFSIG